MFCPNCGKENPDDSYYCRDCGYTLKSLGNQKPVDVPKKETPTYAFKGKWPAFFLCLFLGWTGAHRFYVGKIGTGILYLLTFGGFTLGWFIDFFNIFCGGFRDKNGYPLM